MTQFQYAVNGIGYPGSIHSSLTGVFSYSSDSSTPIQTIACPNSLFLNDKPIIDVIINSITFANEYNVNESGE